MKVAKWKLFAAELPLLNHGQELLLLLLLLSYCCY